VRRYPDLTGCHTRAPASLTFRFPTRIRNFSFGRLTVIHLNFAQDSRGCACTHFLGRNLRNGSPAVVATPPFRQCANWLSSKVRFRRTQSLNHPETYRCKRSQSGELGDRCELPQLAESRSWPTQKSSLRRSASPAKAATQSGKLEFRNGAKGSNLKAALRTRLIRTRSVRPELSYCRSMPDQWRVATLRRYRTADSPTVALLPLQGERLRQLRPRITNVPYASPTSGSSATKSVTPTSIPACESSVVA
jgi:hypothetical protein